MAFEGPQIKLMGFTASADLTSHQYKFVKLNGAGTVTVCAAATDVPVGVLQNAPDTGQAADICVIGLTKLNSDAALSRGNLVGTSADGQADAKTPGTDTTEYTCGQVVQASAAAGGYAVAMINCANLGRAA